jgi:hypothetical protein
MTPDVAQALTKIGGFGLAIMVTYFFGRYLLKRIEKLEAENDKLTDELSRTYVSIGTLAEWMKEKDRRDQLRWTARDDRDVERDARRDERETRRDDRASRHWVDEEARLTDVDRERSNERNRQERDAHGGEESRR